MRRAVCSAALRAGGVPERFQTACTKGACVYDSAFFPLMWNKQYLLILLCCTNAKKVAIHHSAALRMKSSLPKCSKVEFFHTSCTHSPSCSGISQHPHQLRQSKSSGLVMDASTGRRFPGRSRPQMVADNGLLQRLLAFTSTSLNLLCVFLLTKWKWGSNQRDS